MIDAALLRVREELEAMVRAGETGAVTINVGFERGTHLALKIDMRRLVAVPVGPAGVKLRGV